MRTSYWWLAFAVMVTLMVGVGDAQPPGKRGGKGGKRPDFFGKRFSPGSGLERAVADLKLTEKKKESADAAVKEYQETVSKLTNLARAGLLMKMKEILSAEEFKQLQQAADRPERSRSVRGEGPRGRFGRGFGRGSGRPFGGASTIERAVAELKLTDKKKESASAAIKTYQEDTRKLTALARADLLLKMSEIVSADELKKIETALERPSGFGDRSFGRGGSFFGRRFGGPGRGRP